MIGMIGSRKRGAGLALTCSGGVVWISYNNTRWRKCNAILFEEEEEEEGVT